MRPVPATSRTDKGPERRAKHFEERFGEGGTELDARGAPSRRLAADRGRRGQPLLESRSRRRRAPRASGASKSSSAKSRRRFVTPTAKRSRHSRPTGSSSSPRSWPGTNAPNRSGKPSRIRWNSTSQRWMQTSGVLSFTPTKIPIRFSTAPATISNKSIVTNGTKASPLSGNRGGTAHE